MQILQAGVCCHALQQAEHSSSWEPCRCKMPHTTSRHTLSSSQLPCVGNSNTAVSKPGYFSARFLQAGSQSLSHRQVTLSHANRVDALLSRAGSIGTTCEPQQLPELQACRSNTAVATARASGWRSKCCSTQVSEIMGPCCTGSSPVRQ
jgi:hypothetical protein